MRNRWRARDNANGGVWQLKLNGIVSEDSFAFTPASPLIYTEKTDLELLVKENTGSAAAEIDFEIWLLED